MLPSRVPRLLAVVACALLPIACGLHGEAQDPQSVGGAPPGVATGAVQVMLSGSGFGGDELEDVASLNVTVSSVIAFPVEGSSVTPGVGSIGPVNLIGGPETFDLFALQGNTMTLAAGQVPAADYDRVRVEFSGASVTLRNGDTNSLEIDGGTVDLGTRIHVDPNQTAFVSLSINVRDSVRLNRNNQGSLRPILRVQ
jgi:hypothetical protein